jgi:hypothetical protein
MDTISISGALRKAAALLAVAPDALIRAGAGVRLSLLSLAGVSSTPACAAWDWALGQGDMGRTGTPRSRNRGEPR